MPQCNCADNQHRNYEFNTGTPPGAWQVHIGSGLYDFSTTNIGMEEDHNYGLFFGGGDVIWFWSKKPANIVNIGQWSVAGIDFSVQQNQTNGEHYRGAFASFSTTPPGSGHIQDQV